MDISIIIVNYNSGDFLYNCINSITKSITDIKYEIIIVDNNSTDNSLDICRDIISNNVQIIKSDKNLGFSKANNIGTKYAKGTVLHFLNPDTRIDSKMNKDYVEILKDISGGGEMIYSNKLLNRDGTYTDKIVMPLPAAQIRNKFKATKQHDYYYLGATIIISKKLMNRIGGWNEAMFMYCEDTDLFYKAYKNGIKTKEMPSIVYHYGGGSSEKTFKCIEQEIIKQKSLRAFYNTNNINILNYYLLIIIICIELIRHNKLHNYSTYIKAIIKSFK